jgi:hypothetical protein
VEQKSENALREGWLTSAEAAEVAGCSTARIRQLCLGGLVESQKIGRDWLVNRDSLLAYKLTAKPGPKGPWKHKKRDGDE